MPRSATRPIGPRVDAYLRHILPDQVRAYRGLVQQTQPSFADIVNAQQQLNTFLAAYLTALQAQWQAVVDLAALAQLDDLYVTIDGGRLSAGGERNGPTAGADEGAIATGGRQNDSGGRRRRHAGHPSLGPAVRHQVFDFDHRAGTRLGRIRISPSERRRDCQRPPPGPPQATPRRLRRHALPARLGRRRPVLDGPRRRPDDGRDRRRRTDAIDPALHCEVWFGHVRRPGQDRPARGAPA